MRLQFSRYVTPRVMESIWHPSQEIIAQEDGSCIWQANVAEWREMVPWVRGWGADVEVLEPLELRRHIERHVLRLSKLYQMGFVQPSALPEESDDDYDDQWANILFRNGD